jgi:tetratricopeptide (TPR) repeat protein
MVLLLGLFTWYGLSSFVPRIAADPLPAVTAAPVTPAMDPGEDMFGTWKAAGDDAVTQGRYADALNAYDKALEIRPDTADLWVTEGDLYDRIGSFDRAAESYDRALALHPAAAAAIEQKRRVMETHDAMLAEAAEMMESGAPAGAITIYNGMLSAGIQNPVLKKQILSGKMTALLRQGKREEAAAVGREMSWI